MNRTELESFAIACRKGLETCAGRPGSMFYQFPIASCGPAAEIVGRLAKEVLNADGNYVYGSHHPALKAEQTHAWFEVADYIIDITHDQFLGTGLTGWVFESGEGWHAQFAELAPRVGFCMPSGWPSYPFDGYQAALDAVSMMTISPSSGQL